VLLRGWWTVSGLGQIKDRVLRINHSFILMGYVMIEALASAAPFRVKALRHSRTNRIPCKHHLSSLSSYSPFVSMVSTRPSPTPARGRVAYPSASNYTPGDAEKSPTYLGSSPVQQVSSQDSDRDGAQVLKTWWKGFRDRTEPQRRPGMLAPADHR